MGITLEQFEEFAAHQRAVRHFTGKDVPDDLVARLLRVATRAPSARNAQPWRFIVVRDREVKRQLGALFDELGQRMYGAASPERTPWEDVPVLIVVCSEREAFGAGEAAATALGASIYPAVQNLLLAAQAAGLGAVLTTRWKAREEQLRPILGLPESLAVHAIIPVGWPDQRYGRNRRRPISEVTYGDRFGDPWRE
jgi:nitroreductase